MGKHPTDDVSEVDSIEREIDVLRRRTEDLLGELERRVETRVDTARRSVERVRSGIGRARELADVPVRQVREHPRVAAGVGAGTLVLVGVGVYFIVWSRRAEDRKLLRRMQRRARAYRALLADPERALAPRGPSVGRRLVGAVLVAAATTLTKRMIARAV